MLSKLLIVNQCLKRALWLINLTRVRELKMKHGQDDSPGVFIRRSDKPKQIEDVKAENAFLRRSEAHYRAVVDSAHDFAIFTTDLTGKITSWNSGAEHLLGWSAVEAIGQHACMIFTPEDKAKDACDQEMGIAAKQGHAEDERWHRRQNGSLLWGSGLMMRFEDEETGEHVGYLKILRDRTLQHNANQQLQESEALARALFESSADCVKLLELDGTLHSINGPGLCLMEIDDFGSFVGREWASLWPADLRTEVNAAVAEAKSGRLGRFVGVRPTAKGNLKSWDVLVSPVLDGYGKARMLLAVSRDMTEREKEQRAISESEARFRNMADHAPVMMWVTDASGYCNYLNQRWYEFTGQGGSEAQGFGWLDAIHPDDKAEAGRAILAANAAQEPFRTEYRLRRADGVYRWAIDAASPRFGNDGTFLGYVGSVIDIGDRYEMEAKLRELNESLEQRVAKAIAEREKTEEALRQSQKLEAMGSLTGGVAHDFNNLLTPIIGSLDMLTRRGVGNERERRLMDGALQSAERAKVLVQRLLAFARRQPLQPRAVNVKSLVNGMAELIASTSGPRVDVRVELPDELPAATADANQLEMAILNLAVNARDAMPEGGLLTISASCQSLGAGDRAGLRSGPYIRLSITDTGSGMDEATMARAIEPFFSTKGIGKGTGLGLSMVHGLASQLNGELTISSRPGEGTTIDLWLPVSPIAATNDEEIVQAVQPFEAKGTALLVDDEELVRMSTADMLTDLGYDVVEASSAEEALRFVSDGLVPTLLVTDHLMPGMSGGDLARSLKSSRPDMKVLILSGYAEAKGIESGLARLTKPFRDAELRAKLSAL